MNGVSKDKPVSAESEYGPALAQHPLPEEPPVLVRRRRHWRSATRRQTWLAAHKTGVGILTWGLAIVLLLTLAAWFFGDRAIAEFRAWQAQRHITAAHALILEKEWQPAAKEIREAMQLRPKGAPTLRVLAEYLHATRSDPGLMVQTLHSLREMGAAQPEDPLRLSLALLRKGEVNAAYKQFQAMPADLATTQEALELKAAILRQRGEEAQAAAVEKKQAVATPSDPQSDLRGAIKDTTATLDGIQAAAVQKLWELAARQDRTSLEAIRHLALRCPLSLPECQQLLERVESHPDHTLQDRLIIVSALLKADPDHRAVHIESELARHQDAGLEKTLPLAIWLATEKEPDRLLKLWPMELIVQSIEIFPIVAQAMVEAGRWKDLKELLVRSKNLPLSKERRAIWQALVSTNLDADAAATRTHLETAIRQGHRVGQFNVVMTAAQLAEHLRLWDLAVEGYQLLAEPGKPHEMQMLQTCWQVAQRSRSIPLQLQIAEKLHTVRPGIQDYSQRLDYLHLLTGQQMETTTSAPPSPFDAESHTAAAHLVASLKAYRMGDLPLARQFLTDLPAPKSLPPGQRAVVAGLLATLGDPARAYQIAETVPSDLISSEEKRFLNKAL